MLWLEERFQFRQCAVQSYGDDVGTDVQMLGDIAWGKPVDVAHYQHGPMLLGKLFQRLHHHVSVREMRRIGSVVPNLDTLFTHVFQGRGPVQLIAAVMIDDQVVGDAVEECANVLDVLTLSSGHEFPCFHKGILHKIFCEFPVTDSQSTVAEDGIGIEVVGL